MQVCTLFPNPTGVDLHSKKERVKVHLTQVLILYSERPHLV